MVRARAKEKKQERHVNIRGQGKHPASQQDGSTGDEEGVWGWRQPPPSSLCVFLFFFFFGCAFVRLLVLLIPPWQLCRPQKASAAASDKKERKRGGEKQQMTFSQPQQQQQQQRTTAGVPPRAAHRTAGGRRFRQRQLLSALQVREEKAFSGDTAPLPRIRLGSLSQSSTSPLPHPMMLFRHWLLNKN